MSVAFSPDGQHLLTGAWDSKWGRPGPGEAWLWAPKDWKPVGPPSIHPGPVVAVAFSPDGRRAITGSQDGTILLRDTADGSAVTAPKTLPYRLRALAFSPDGTWFVTGGELPSGAGVVDRWDATSGVAAAPPWLHAGPVEAVAVSPDGQFILAGCAVVNRSGAVVGGEARLWSSVHGSPVGRVLPHSDAVKSVAFSPDGQTVLTGCDDAMARLWDRETGQHLGVPQPHDFPVLAVAFSPDGKTVVSGGGRLKPLGAGFEVAFFEAADDHITARYSLGCDWPRSLLRRFCPEGVSKASASSFNSFCSADWRTAPARP